MADERRRYFRIDDLMGVSYNLLGRDEAEAFAKRSKEQGGNFDYASHFDNRIQTLLDSCKIQSPIAGELMDLMNKKLNFVIQQMDIDSELMHKVAYKLREVNVSACGMAFANEEVLNRGQRLQLDISLQPSDLHIVAMAEVVNCAPLSVEEADDNCVCFVRLNFLEINAHDQELLIQHVVKRQSAKIKEMRGTVE